MVILSERSVRVKAAVAVLGKCTNIANSGW
jgi:hypothetical protein